MSEGLIVSECDIRKQCRFSQISGLVSVHGSVEQNYQCGGNGDRDDFRAYLSDGIKLDY